MWNRSGVVVRKGPHRHEVCVCACGARGEVRILRDGSLRTNGCRSCNAGRRPTHGRYCKVIAKCARGPVVMCRTSRQSRSRTHAVSTSPEYRSWIAMMYRTLNPKRARYAAHGGRGILPCQRLRDFAGFRAELGDRPDGTTLERPNNDRGYDCGECDDCIERLVARNVKWATPVEQGNNTRRNVFIEHDGRHLTAAQWAEETGLNDKTIYQRWRAGDRGARLFRASEKPWSGATRANAPHLRHRKPPEWQSPPAQ